MRKREIIVGIYKITSPSGRVYIGKTFDFIRRKWDYASHKADRQRILLNSIAKYGLDNHSIEIICRLPEDIDGVALSKYEMVYIEQYRTNINKYPTHRGMNLTDGGEGTRGHRWTEEAKEKFKKTIKDKGLRLGEKNGLFGRKGEKNHFFGVKGEAHPAFGYRHTEDAKKRMSEKRNGKPKKGLLVVNTITGIEYKSISDAARQNNIHRDTLRNWLTGRWPNKTPLTIAKK